MGNDRSPESQHNVGDTIIYDAQRQTVFNLGNFRWDHFHLISDKNKTPRERSGSVVECLTRDRRAAGSSLTGVTALWSLSKTHLS